MENRTTFISAGHILIYSKFNIEVENLDLNVLNVY